MLVRYKMVIATGRCVAPRWLFTDRISNACSWNNCHVYNEILKYYNIIVVHVCLPSVFVLLARLCHSVEGLANFKLQISF